MAALTVERKTPKLGQDVLPSFACNLPLPVAAATKLFGGGMIAQNILGNIVAASALASLVVVGVSEKTVDNSTGIAGALTTVPRVGTFLMNNSGAGVDQITVANAGQVCYVADDNTVALTSLGGTRPVAGIIWALDNPVAGTFPQYPSGVWVAIIPGLSAVLGLSAPIAQYATLLDAAAGTATAETIIGYVKNPGSISGCLYTPSAAVVFNAANYATINIIQRNGIGGAPLTVASYATSAVGFSAFQPASLGVLANALLVPGSVLSYTVTKAGAGVQLPAGLLSIV
jgi:hypothetical protein